MCALCAQALSVDPRPRPTPWEERVPTRFVLAPREQAVLGAVPQPFFYTGSSRLVFLAAASTAASFVIDRSSCNRDRSSATLWSLQTRRRHSESFHFDFNDAATLRMLGAHFQVAAARAHTRSRRPIR